MFVVHLSGIYYEQWWHKKNKINKFKKTTKSGFIAKEYILSGLN